MQYMSRTVLKILLLLLLRSHCRTWSPIAGSTEFQGISYDEFHTAIQGRSLPIPDSQGKRTIPNVADPFYTGPFLRVAPLNATVWSLVDSPICLRPFHVFCPLKILLPLSGLKASRPDVTFSPTPVLLGTLISKYLTTCPYWVLAVVCIATGWRFRQLPYFPAHVRIFK